MSAFALGSTVRFVLSPCPRLADWASGLDSRPARPDLVWVHLGTLGGLVLSEGVLSRPFPRAHCPGAEAGTRTCFKERWVSLAPRRPPGRVWSQEVSLRYNAQCVWNSNLWWFFLSRLVRVTCRGLCRHPQPGCCLPVRCPRLPFPGHPTRLTAGPGLSAARRPPPGRPQVLPRAGGHPAELEGRAVLAGVSSGAPR